MNSTIRTKDLFIGLLLALVVSLVAGVFSRLNVDVHHQGLMYSAAAGLLDGRGIYSSDYYYGPLVPVVNALGLGLFGRYLVVLQFMAALVYGVIAVVLWRIWKRFLPGWLSCISVLASFLLAPFFYWEFHPWSSVYSLLFLSLSSLWMLKWIETGNVRLLYLVGLWNSLAFWSRQSVGILLIIGSLFVVLVVVWNRRREQRTSRSLYPLLASTGALLIAGLILLKLFGSLGIWFHASFTSRVDWAVSISGGIGWQLAYSVVWCLFDGFRPTLWALLPIVLLASFIGALVWMLRDRPSENNEASLFFVYISFCLISWLQYYPVSDPRHHFWSVLPAFPIVIFLGRMFFGRSARSSFFGRNQSVLLLGRALFVVSLSGFCFTYGVETKERFFTGVNLDPTLRLNPAWKRLDLYDVAFLNPPVLKGMLGSASQVDALNRIYLAASDVQKKHPTVRLINRSGWDFLAASYLDSDRAASGVRGNSNDPVIVLSDDAKPPPGFRLVDHVSVNPAFAYQLNSPGDYYLFESE